jgi:hypothetical protein
VVHISKCDIEISVLDKNRIYAHLNLEIRDKVMKKEKEMYQKKTRKATLK